MTPSVYTTRRLSVSHAHTGARTKTADSTPGGCGTHVAITPVGPATYCVFTVVPSGYDDGTIPVNQTETTEVLA